MTIGSNNILVMGIVNLTDDSFFDGSRMLLADGSLDRSKLRQTIRQMLSDGADILDIGPFSSRPGSRVVEAPEQWRRLREALPIIREEAPFTPLSIDTCYADVIRRVHDFVGEVIVNDISAGMADSSMLQTVGELGLPYIAMHMKGTPETMQQLTDYKGDIVSEVKKYFINFSHLADAAGIRDWYLDPGFGFAKTTDQNYALLDSLATFKEFGRPILVGISRKSMIYKPLGLEPKDVLAATQALHMAALERGASILRVHDTAAACQTVALFRQLEAASQFSSTL